MGTQIRRFKVPLLCLTILQLVCCISSTLGQVSDGDDQFQAYHQDIGRISGSNGAQVAAQSTIVERPQSQSSEPAEEPAPPVAPRPAPVVQQQRAQASRLSSTGSRKPNRITLVARRDPLPSASAALAPLVSAAPSFSSEHEQAQQGSFDSAPTQQQQRLQTQQETSSFSGPALASFRDTPVAAAAPPPSLAAPTIQASLSSSVSARHSALMAEVAAERAAAEELSDADSPPHTLQATAPSQFQAASSFSSSQHTQPQPAGHLAQPAIENPTFIAAPAPDEPVPSPSFEQVLSGGCPSKGVHSWENKDHCDRYYMCTNGTFTEEACPNGLAYSQMGAVYQHCAYNWNVDCGRKKSSEPIASPGCPWQFGIFPILQNGRCSIDYYVCEWGVPETKRCTPEGLFYDDRIKGCQWADQLGCKSEALLNFKCPSEDEDNPYWPYPRYYHNTQDVIVCVNEQPRLVHCNEDQLVDPSSLACIEVKKKKKFQS